LEPSPLDGGGLGGGDATQRGTDDGVQPSRFARISLFQNHGMRFQETDFASLPPAVSDRAGRRRFPRSTGPRGKQNQQCNDRWALGGGTCSHSSDASAIFARATSRPRSFAALERGLTCMRRRRDTFSFLDWCSGKYHPLPTLPHQGGGLFVSFATASLYYGGAVPGLLVPMRGL